MYIVWNVYVCAYTHIKIYITTIKEQEAMKLKKSKVRVIWESLEGGKGERK